MQNRIRAAAILIKDENIVLIRRVKELKAYYTFPGGSVKEGETIEQAVVREVTEETSIQVSIHRLLYSYDDVNSSQYFYLCDYISGNPQISPAAEENQGLSEHNIFEPQWIALRLLPKLLLYPLEIKDWLLKDLKNGYPTSPRKAVSDGKNNLNSC